MHSITRHWTREQKRTFHGARAHTLISILYGRLVGLYRNRPLIEEPWSRLKRPDRGRKSPERIKRYLKYILYWYKYSEQTFHLYNKASLMSYLTIFDNIFYGTCSIQYKHANGKKWILISKRYAFNTITHIWTSLH